MKPTLDELKQQAAEKIASNSDRLNRLAHHGLQVNIPGLVQKYMIELLFPGEYGQAEFEIGFQERLSEELDDAEANVDRMTLENAIQSPPPGLILPPGV